MGYQIDADQHFQMNAIQQGILTKSTKERLEELEAAKEELENRLANEQLSKPPKISAEFMTFWLHRFRKLDVTKQSHRKMLIDTFINAIFLSGNDARNGENPHEYRLFCPSILLLILD